MKKGWYQTASSEDGTVYTEEHELVVPYPPEGANENTHFYAEMIVRCVNSNGELIRALESVIALLELVESDMGRRSIAATDAINYARQAIRKGTRE